MTSFFICDDDWEKEKEVTLEEMDDNPEIDSWVMKETPISELTFSQSSSQIKKEVIWSLAYPTDFSIASWKSKNVASQNVVSSSN